MPSVLDDVEEADDEDDVEEDEEVLSAFELSAAFFSSSAFLISAGVLSAVPAWAVQFPGVLLFLYQPMLFEGQAEVASRPVLVQ